MKTVILFFVIVLIPMSIAYTQPIDTLWTKTISYSGSSVQGTELVKYSPDEFIVTGSFGDSLYIVKLTSQGNIVWEKYLYETGGLFGKDIDKDSLGNFYILVWNYNASSEWKLLKFNELGDTLWSLIISDPRNSFHKPYAITVNSNYVYVAASAGNGPENYVLHKFNLDGDSLYTKTYSTGSDFSIPRSITNDSYGNVILVGTGGGTSGEYGYIFKCNPNGDTLWSKPLFELGEALSVLTDDEDNIIVTGFSNRIIKFDTNGNLVFSKTLGGNQYWQGSKLVWYDNNNILVVGTVRNAPLIVFDVILGKYSLTSGDTVWTYVYDHPDNTFFGAYGLDGCVLFDTTLAVLSYTSGLLSGYWYDNIYIVDFWLADKPVSVESNNTINIESFSLEQNYPNPFNLSTKIVFITDSYSKITLKVFNVLGQEIETLLDGELQAGKHEAEFNASGLSSGIYFYRIEAVGINGESFSSAKTMVLLK